MAHVQIDAQDDLMRIKKSGNACHCSVLICYCPVSSTNRLWCFRWNFLWKQQIL